MDLANELGLKEDELALYFVGIDSINAAIFSQFIQKISTVASRQGVELQVVAFRTGSLATIIKAIRSSSTGQAALGEFQQAPVATTAAATAIVAAVVGAIAYAMAPGASSSTPAAKAGAEIIQKCHVEEIRIITLSETVKIMDREQADYVTDYHRSKSSRASYSVSELAKRANHGILDGVILEVEGDLHFRPNGFSFLVPIDMRQSEAASYIRPQAHFRVYAQLLTYRGQPNSIIIHEARRV